MSAPLTVDASWLRSDPSEMMGHHCPTTFNELVHSSRPVWARLYRDWFPSNIGRALPGWKNDEAMQAYEWATDKSKVDNPQYKPHRDAFEAAYKASFYEDIEKIKDQLHAAEKQHPGMKKEEIYKQAGSDLAKEAVKKKIKAEAGALKAPEVLMAWAQVQVFKQEQLSKFKEALQGFSDAKWGEGGQKADAISVLQASHPPVSSTEAALRDLITKLQGQQSMPKVFEDELFEKLVDWANAIDGMTHAMGQAGQLVLDWAEENAAKIMKEDFDAAFPLLGGALLALRVSVGAAGAVLAFFPKLGPIASGLSLADSVLEYSIKRLTVLYESKQGDNMVKYAGTKFELPEDYFETNMGKVYQTKKKIEDAIDSGVDWVKAQLTALLDSGVKITEEALAAIIGQEKMAQLKALKQSIQAKIDSVTDTATAQQLAEDAAFVKDCMLQVANILGYDVEEPSFSGLIKNFLFDGLKTVAPELAKLLTTAMPIIGTIQFAFGTFKDVIEFHASVHKVLVSADGYTAEQTAQVQGMVRTALANGGPVLMALDFESVEYHGPDGDGNHKLTLAGIAGVLNKATLRFSPDDDGAMLAAVQAAAKRDNPEGRFEVDGSIFKIDWATFALEGGKTGQFKAHAMARRTHIKNEPLNPDDGRDWAIDVLTDSSGGMSLRDKHLLGAQGAGGKALFRQDANVGANKPLVKQTVVAGGGLAGGEMKGFKFNIFAGTN